MLQNHWGYSQTDWKAQHNLHSRESKGETNYQRERQTWHKISSTYGAIPQKRKKIIKAWGKCEYESPSRIRRLWKLQNSLDSSCVTETKGTERQKHWTPQLIATKKKIVNKTFEESPPISRRRSNCNKISNSSLLCFFGNRQTVSFPPIVYKLSLTSGRHGG
jgi:hypothetical protein